jgi:hypothetical protein
MIKAPPRTAKTKTKALPRGPLSEEASRNTSTVEVTAPAPKVASATPARSPAESMVKAPAGAPETKTKAPPRGPLPDKSSGKTSTAEVTLPAPVDAPVIVPPPLAAGPAETMVKAPAGTPETKTKAVKSPPQAKIGAQVRKPAPKTSGTIVATLPSAFVRADIRVQLGAVKSKARAEKEAERLTRAHKPVLDGLKVVFARADLGERGIFYRLRAGPLANYTAAAALCRKLAARKQGCIVVKP